MERGLTQEKMKLCHNLIKILWGSCSLGSQTKKDEENKENDNSVKLSIGLT